MIRSSLASQNQAKLLLKTTTEQWTGLISGPVQNSWKSLRGSPIGGWEQV
jgi:hypothetical protein